MIITVARQRSANGCTIGRLSINGVAQCWTLEDEVRAPGVKVLGKTAIPAGSYGVRVTHSPRFNTRLPLLLAVPGFEGVRIHPGNTADDTDGCILVGQDKGRAAILRSRAAFAPLLARIEAAQLAGEPVTLRIEDAAP
jgi:hypothetical protein